MLNRKFNFLFMNHKTAFAERLKAAMLAAGYEPRPGVLEKGFNQRYWGRSVTFQAVRRWLNGDSIPAQDKLEVLAEWLRVEPQILRFGEQAVQSVRSRQQAWDTAPTYQERELFEAYLSLPADHRKVLREVILAFVEAYGNKERD